jgi:hypothetical protein
VPSIGRQWRGPALLRVAAAVLAILGTLAVAAPAEAQQLFSADSYRNTPLPPDAPVDVLSGAYVNDLAGKAESSGAFVNHAAYSTPVYTVTPRHKKRQVFVTGAGHRDCSNGSPCLVEQWRRVPLPKYPVPAPGTDGWMVVYQPSSDTMWEFWKFRMSGGRAYAEFGGRIEHLSANPGYYTATPGARFGASATSIPLLAGLQRIDELRSGSINHVVSFAMRDPQRGFRWPAQRGDGVNALIAAAPEGTCFRLPATLNVDALPLTPYGRTLARAVQRYGMVMSDSTSVGLAFFAEVGRKGTDPYSGPNGIFTGLQNSGGPDGVLRGFPWRSLQALAPGVC